MIIKANFMSTIIKRREVDIQRSILQGLRKCGYVCGKTRTMGVKQANGVRYTDRYTFRGFPDLTAFVPWLLYIEVKAPGGRQRPEQKDFQKMCHKASVRYIVAYDLVDVLKAISHGPVKPALDIDRTADLISNWWTKERQKLSADPYKSLAIEISKSLKELCYEH